MFCVFDVHSMTVISFFKPTFSKVLLAIIVFLLINSFFFVCSPIAYETQGPVGSRDIGFHIGYTCGIISMGIERLFGNPWINHHPIFYWFLYLPLSYLLSSALCPVKKKGL